MKIALHLGTLRGFGSAVVGRSVLAALAAAPRDHDLLAWVPAEWELPALPGVELRRTAPGIGHKLAFENLTLRRALRAWRADALFSLGDTSLPLCPVPHLLLVQQAFVAYPWSAFDFPLSRRFRARFALMGAYLRAGLPTVGHVTVQTEHMRRAFAARWRFPADRITVVPSSVQPAALAVAAGSAAADPGEAPYLAYVSGGGPHKNHVVLADAMARLAPAHPALRCRLTVDPADVPALAARAEQLGVADRFVYEGFRTAAAAMRLLRGAAVAVIPSRFESFGIPYYEALAVGAPVVASDRVYAREPLGAAARYADPDDGAAWASAIAGALADRPALSAASAARFAATHHPWASIAASYLDLLEALAAR